MPRFDDQRTGLPKVDRLDFIATRRRMLQLLGASSLALAGTSLLTKQAFAGGSAARTAHLSRFQEGTPEAVPMATPVIGAQADGSTLWKVVVGGMDMENAIEYTVPLAVDVSRATNASLTNLPSSVNT